MKKIFVLCVVVLLVGAGIWIYLHPDTTSGLPDARTEAPLLDLAALSAKAQTGDAHAQFEYGKALIQPGSAKPDYKAAIEWLKKSAGNGNTDATSLLGELTMGGQGVVRDPKAAVELFRSAAERGNVSAQYNLGYCYERGDGVENDEKAATKWYRLAAEGGDVTAQFDVAQRFELGLGAETDLAEAYKWYVLAANQGQPDAITKLASLKSRLSSALVREGEKRVSSFAPRK